MYINYVQKVNIMTDVNVTEFRSRLPDYLARVKRGEEIRILRHGRVMAVLSPPSDQRGRARDELTLLRDTARVDDVDSPLDLHWHADGPA